MLSSDADATSWPSGQKATALTDSEWLGSVLRQDPVPVSQSRTVLSCDADATSWPSGEKAIALTSPEWPLSVLRQDPVPASQSQTVLLSDADATSWPSGKKATALTSFEWPSSVCTKAFQSFCTFGNLVTTYEYGLEMFSVLHSSLEQKLGLKNRVVEGHLLVLINSAEQSAFHQEENQILRHFYRLR